MATNPTSYPLFSGTVRHALDPKNRTTIPSDWRPETPAPIWLVPQSDHECLLAMPEEEFRAVPARVEALPDFSAEERAAFLDLFFADAEKVVPDKQGRFVIPERFCESLKLQGEIVLSGAHAKFKIWHPPAWSAFVERRRSEGRQVARHIAV